MSNPYYGKYRGKVANPIDPLGLGRIQVEVSAVYGDGILNWAMPCAPYAGPGVGFFAIPPKDANIWVEFEAGDIDSPIWSGCFWAAGEAPDGARLAPTIKLLKTDFASIKIEDIGAEQGVVIETTAGARIAITTTGIVIDNGMGGKIEMQGPKISVNGGALEVI